jgi:ribonucleoside-diphosphate reductase alpha chain
MELNQTTSATVSVSSKWTDLMTRKVALACNGLSGVKPVDIIRRTLAGLQDTSSENEVSDLLVQNSVMFMAEEPNYSKVASRLLSQQVELEVNSQLSVDKISEARFEDYLTTAVQVGLLASSVADKARQDIELLEEAMNHERDDFFEYFGLKTVADRYLLRHPTTRKLIERPQWLFMRVCLGLAKSAKEAIEFYNTVSTFDYMPATPTLFNSGTNHPQMSSCYLLTVADDSLEGIYKSIADCARLSKFSGGIGIDWTNVRSNGALIKGTNGLSNGIIPFLKVFDSSVHAVNQGGKRKGAAAVYLEPWHSDIESFLELRNNTGAEERRTHNLNLALWISDLFMKRVESNGDWSLFSPSDVRDLHNLYGEAFEKKYEQYESEGKAKKKVSARQLYGRMMQSLAETGNGWICFKDQANLRSAQTAKEGNTIHSSNLCTEILEVTSSKETAVCNLGSINLSKFVKTDGTFDFVNLAKTARQAVSILDRVVDINFYPTVEAKDSNLKWRPVGLGIMGLQDALFQMRIPFGSPEASRISSRISATVYWNAIESSIELAKAEGSFPAYNESRYGEAGLQPLLTTLNGFNVPETEFDWNALNERVKKEGLRNSLLIAIAPTATIASIVGSYESIEPQISNIFKRETLSGEFLQVNRYLVRDLQKIGLWNETMKERIISQEGSIQNVDGIPAEVKELYKTTWEISQKNLIDLAADRQSFICQSQSLNLFMEDPNVGKLSSMYMYAWKRGVKTTYYLRSRAKTSIKKTTVSETTTSAAAVTCSLENPASCESCQ